MGLTFVWDKDKAMVSGILNSLVDVKTYRQTSYKSTKSVSPAANGAALGHASI